MKNEIEKIIELFRDYALKRFDNHKSELKLSHHTVSGGCAEVI